MTVGAPSYKGFRFPTEIISHCVWLYYQFPLSSSALVLTRLGAGLQVRHRGYRSLRVG